MNKTLLIALSLAGITCTASFAQIYDNVSCGTEFGIAHRSDNTLWVWGFNGNGQLGLGNTSTQTSPQQLPGNWMTVAAGGFHTIALSTDSTLWGAGLNSLGQIGSASTNQSVTSMQQASTSIKFRSISAGFAHTLAIGADGTLWAAGYNGYGQLGNGTTTDIGVITQVDTSTNWRMVSAGGIHSAGIKDDGTLWTWGYNMTGQLGLGNTDDTSSPTQVGTDNDWVAVSAGFEYCIALKANGTLWSWGFNGNNQLGRTVSGSFDADPGQVGSDTDWDKIAAAASFAFAIKEDSTLWGWGFNDFGQLGMDNSVAVNTPTQIGADNDWVAISGATGAFVNSSVLGTHAAGLKADAETICTAGSNYVGQLGNGLTSNTPQDEFGCDITTSVANSPQPESIAVYPNPASETLFVQLPASVKEGVQLSITDVSGRVVLQRNLTDTKEQLNIASLSPGSYFVQITTGSGSSFYSRFIKQ